MEQFIEFTGNHPYLVGAAVALLVMIVFNEVRLATRGYNDVAPADAVKLINVDATVIDVRSVDAYRTGHIVGAKNVPLDELDADGSKLKKLKEKPVLTYCDNGITGARAASSLRSAGFSKVFNLRGGLEAWRRDNYPLAESA